MSIKSKEEIMEMADTLYWEFIGSLPEEIQELYVVFDSDNELNSTINTEKGSELYWGIEDMLTEWVGEE